MFHKEMEKGWGTAMPLLVHEFGVGFSMHPICCWTTIQWPNFSASAK